MRRILVVGMSGAGKTTAAREIARRLDLSFHEMDQLAIGPEWSTPPGFVDDVDRMTRGESWVTDSWGQPEVRDLLWSRADTVVWLDYPRHVVWPRLVRRSLLRSWRRELVFGGNRERWRDWLGRDHPVWHAVTTFKGRRRYLAGRTQEETHLRTFRLRSQAELDAWLADLSR